MYCALGLSVYCVTENYANECSSTFSIDSAVGRKKLLNDRKPIGSSLTARQLSVF